jgi:hypothetical protein
LSYRGISKADALAKLTKTVRDRLQQEGLERVNYEAHDALAIGGQAAVSQTLIIPDTLSVEDHLKAQAIAGDEAAKFMRERYGVM